MQTAKVFGLLFFLAAAAHAAGGSSWPDWRGPYQDLKVQGAGAFPADGEKPLDLDIVWRRTVGLSYSSVVVAGGKAVTMASDGKLDQVIAFDAATGAELWRAPLGETYRGHSGSEDGPLGTPLLQGGRVYVLGPRGQLVALDLEQGRELWRHDLVAEYGAQPPSYGFSSTPIVIGRVLVVQAGSPEGAVLGFDAATGEKRWAAGSDAVHHESPRALTLGGETVALVLTVKYLMAIRPTDGAVLFQHEYGMRTHDAAGQAVILGANRVLVSDWESTAAFEIQEPGEGAEGTYTVRELWRSDKVRNHHVMPIYHQGHLYGYSGRFLTCYSAETGEIVWRSRPPGGDAGLTLVDGHLILVAPGGEVVVVRPSPEGYHEVARWPLFDRRTLSPASFADGRFYLRVGGEVASIAFRAAAGPPAESRQAETSPAPDSSAFGRFLAQVEAAPQERRAALVNAFVTEQARTPLVEADGTVHFFYQGEPKVSGRPRAR